MKKQCLFLILSIFLLAACNNISNEKIYKEIDAPSEIAERAFRFAELYEQSETAYELGGQTPVRSAIKIDCSGLVIMSYKYALVDTKYELLETDMTANYMYKNASHLIKKSELRKGDLLFMGDIDSNNVTHIAIFDRIENGNIYFIDSTQKENVDGVTHRFYSEHDKRFKDFGIMRIKY